MSNVGPILIGFLLLGLLGLAATVWLVRRMWRRRSTTSRLAKLAAALVAASAVYGALGTLRGVIMAFGAVGGESVDPSQKARILAVGISEAMNCTFFSLLIWLPSVIVALVITRTRKPRSE